MQSEAVSLHISNVDVFLCPGSLPHTRDSFHLITEVENLIVQAEKVCVSFLCSQ